MASNRNSKTDDEAYWNEQTKRDNFFDDGENGELDFHKLKKSMKDFQEDDEVIDWTGNPLDEILPLSTSKPLTSARNHVSKGFTGVHSGPVEVGPKVTKPGIKSGSSSFSASSSLLVESNHKKSSSLGDKMSIGISRPTFVVSNPSLESAVRRDTAPSHTEHSKLNAEVNSLRRKLQSMERARWNALAISDTVTRMIMGETYSLELYKSLEDKLKLLDAACEYHDGNSIIAVVLFLKTTLKRSIFIREICKRPVAINQYAVYLQSTGEHEELARELKVLGRDEEAAMWQYRLALQQKSAQARYQSMIKCVELYFEGYKSVFTETVFLRDQCSLLNKQILIESADAKASKERRPPFTDAPKEAELYFQPLITTLYYCCKYHYDEPQTSKSCPQSLMKEYNMTDKQYILTAVKARANLKKWKDIETLLTPKKWLGKAKKPAVGFDRIVAILLKASAPYDILEKYMLLIVDLDIRLEMARKFQIHSVVIETLKQMKDFKGLQNYQGKVAFGTREDIQLQSLLKNTAIKWKN